MQIWIGQMLSPKDPLYNMAFCFELNCKLDFDRFTVAFQDLIKASDVLRTVFFTEDGEPRQKVLAEFTYQPEMIDYSDENDPNVRLEAFLDHRKKKLFDWSKPVFDCAIIKLADSRFVWYFNQHHLITDGWSFALAYKYVENSYRHSNGSLVEMSKISPYSAYITRELEAESLNQNLAAENYWQEKLKELPEPPTFFGEQALRPQSQSSRVYVDLGMERSQQLMKLAKEPGIKEWTEPLTLFNIFTTVFFALLYRVSGQNKMAIGAPSHNRSEKSLRETIGLIMEIYPFMVQVDENDTFKDLYKKVRYESFAFLKNAHKGRPTSELNRKFNALINFIPGAFSDFNGTPVKVKSLHPEHHDPAHHIRLQIHDYEATGTFKLLFDLNEEIFGGFEKSFVPDQYIRLLDQFINDSSHALEDCQMVGLPELNRIVSYANPTQKHFPEPVSVLDFFEQQVLKTPDATALVFEDEKLTYSQFNEKANQLARFLSKAGINRNDGIVAVCMERSLELMISIYGILKAGGVYLPLDPHHPVERIHFCLEDAGASYIISQSRFYENWADTTVPLLYVDRDWTEIDQESKGSFQIADRRPDDLAYIIYTSGSTGKPKGVMIEHRSICNHLQWMQDQYPLGPPDKMLQKTPVVFDVSMCELFLPLQYGAQLVLLEPEAHKDPIQLAEIIQKHAINLLHFVPSMMVQFLEGKEIEYYCQSVQKVFLTGEAVTTDLQNRFFERLNGAELHNLYGPTEATVHATYWECKPGRNEKRVPIGYPLTNTPIYILNQHLQLAPIGVPGELYIGGVQVARGYLNREDLNAERFIPDPFSTLPDARLYKSGDLARLRPDGAFEYLGRLDHQIKLRGFRIELGEIAARLSLYDEISQAVAILQKASQPDAYIAAYYAAPAKIDEDLLREFLNKSLPYYMIPSIFIQMDQLPVGSSGKIDRKALPVPNFEELWKETPLIAPRTDIEELLAQEWKEVLQIQKIGVNQSFVSLGGHSLLAIRLMARLNEILGLDIPAHQVFHHSTIASLSELIQNKIEKLLAEE